RQASVRKFLAEFLRPRPNVRGRIRGPMPSLTVTPHEDDAGRWRPANSLWRLSLVPAIQCSDRSAHVKISSSMSATSISVVDNHCRVLGISEGQMRHVEPSLSSTMWPTSCFLICIANLLESSGRLRSSSGCLCRRLSPCLGCVLRHLHNPFSQLFGLVSQ